MLRSIRGISGEVCVYHVYGAAVVRVLRQHPDPLLQDVTVVHHNLTHILKTHGELTTSHSHVQVISPAQHPSLYLGEFDHEHEGLLRVGPGQLLPQLADRLDTRHQVHS